MFKVSTWAVCSLLNLAVQLDKVYRAGPATTAALVEALIIALIIGAVWAFIAGWVRRKFLPNLSTSFVRNLQIGLGAIGGILILGLVYKHTV